MQSSPSWHTQARSVLTVLLYAAAVVWTSIYPSGWTVLVVALPLAAALWSYALSSWRQPGAGWPSRLKGAIAFIAFAVALWLLKPFLLDNFKWVYLLQHAGIHLALAWVFANSLKAGAVPLCTQFARLVQPDDTMSDAALRYTRQVTVAWVVFFVAIGVASILIFWLCSLAVWTLFSTFVTFGLTAAMFAVEAMIRRHALPARYSSSFATTWRAVERHFRGGQAS